MSEPAAAPARVAVVKPCCIGDCVMALPALAAVQETWPAAYLTVFVGQHSRAVFDGQSGVTAITPIADQPGPATALGLARRLRRGCYGAVVLLDRSRWCRLGVALSRSPRSGRVVPQVPESRHESDVYRDVVRSLGLTASDAPPKLQLPDTARAAAFLLAGNLDRVAVLHAGGAENPGTAMPSKRWPRERFVKLAGDLTARGLNVLLSGGAADRDLALGVASAAGLPETRVVAGRADLLTTGALLERARLYVGPDTGLSHIAAAVGAPTVAIFGPTNPARYRPLGPRVTVLAPPTSWRLPDTDLRRGQVVDPSASTDAISVAEVLAACDALLASSVERR